MSVEYRKQNGRILETVRFWETTCCDRTMNIHVTGGIYFSGRDVGTEQAGIPGGNTRAGSSSGDSLVSDETPPTDDRVPLYPGQHYPLMTCSHDRRTELGSSQQLAVTPSP